MITRMGQFIQRTKRHMDEHGTSITLKWNTWAGGTTDPTTGEKVGATVTANTSTIKGWVHYVNPAMTGYKNFTQLVVGDAILVLDPGVSLDGKADLIFEFEGKSWQQKRIDDQVFNAIDASFGGQTITHVVIVTLRA